MANINPYTIHVPDAALEDLSKRLSFARYPDRLDGGSQNQWNFGAPVEEIRRLAEYWKNDFDWRKAEKSINDELPNFMTKVHIEVWRARHSLSILTISGIRAKLMPNSRASRYTEYVTQGGDWGFSITRAIGLQYPEHCKASHLNMVLALPPTFSDSPLLALKHAVTPYSKEEAIGLVRSAWFQDESYGYNILQSTKPQTIGFALADSPVALLAWIYEKLHDWSEDYPWTDDEILTWVSIYLFSVAGPEASVRIYHEATHPEPQSKVDTATLRKWIPHVKLGLAHFPGDIIVVPDIWGHTLGPVVHQSRHKQGGHFAATEVPEAVAEDLKTMFGKNGPCYGIVSGRPGY